jgi:lysophospholipase L1-like esterase
VGPFVLALILAVPSLATLFSPGQPGFDFGSSVTCADRGGTDALRADFCTGEGPFFFSVPVSEGNYRVTVTLGDATRSSVTTIKAESRRLMAHAVRTAVGEWKDVTFTVNVRTPALAAGEQVRINGREATALHWDDKLTLEFSDERPAVASIILDRVEDAVTVFLAGDSTVTDQTREPYAAWGQMLPFFFGPEVAIANHAESGRTLRSFRSEGRLAKILSQIGRGDYLFVQFAHNDQKPGPNHAEPFGDYDDQLRELIREARTRGATPVLVTSVYRRRFDSEGVVFNTLGDYAAAMKALGQAEGVAVIDLGAASRTLFQSLGVEGSKKAFLHHPAGSFPEQKEAIVDDTHGSTYGAYELARIVVQGIKTSGLDLARHLRPIPDFDSTRPDPFDEWQLPLSPLVSSGPAPAVDVAPVPARP